MTIYIAYNGPHSVTTAIAVASTTTTTAGGLVTLQLGIPSGQFIALVGFGISMAEDPTAAVAANAAQFEIASTATATTMGTAHSTSTVRAFNNTPDSAQLSSLTMTTAGCAYTAAGTAITSNTTIRYAYRGFMPPTGSFDMLWPSDCRPLFGAAAAAEFVQFRVFNNIASCPTIAYLMWDEF